MDQQTGDGEEGKGEALEGTGRGWVAHQWSPAYRWAVPLWSPVGGSCWTRRWTGFPSLVPCWFAGSSGPVLSSGHMQDAKQYTACTHPPRSAHTPLPQTSLSLILQFCCFQPSSRPLPRYSFTTHLLSLPFHSELILKWTQVRALHFKWSPYAPILMGRKAG